MRKDRIEERITGIERDMKELRSEVRQDIMSMSSELKDVQVSLVEDMLAGIQDTMSKGYRQIAYDLNITNAEKKFKEQMSLNCPPGADRDGCIRHMVEDHLRADAVNLDSASPDMTGSIMKTIIDRDNQDYEGEKGTVCEGCMVIYQAERDKLLDMSEKFTVYRKALSVRRSNHYFKQLPDDLTVSELIEPLSHRARFVMLKNLTSGCMTFTDLGVVTGYDGGHLTYHLNKLISAGLVDKDEKGAYRITEKGMGVMEVIRKMYGR